MVEHGSQFGIEQQDPLTYVVYCKRFHPNGQIASEGRVVLNKYEVQELLPALSIVVDAMKTPYEAEDPNPDLPRKFADPQLAETIFQWIPGKKCKKCGSPLLPADLVHYRHASGWAIPSMKERQWLYFECHHCGDQISVNKLGLTRIQCKKCGAFLTTSEREYNEFPDLCGSCNETKLYNMFEPEYHGDPNSELPWDQ